MKYKDSEILLTITRVDLILVCYYWLNFSKMKYSKITVGGIKDCLIKHDYNYIELYESVIKNDIKRLFPIKMNNQKKTKYFKISNQWITYWGKVFNINYTQHKQFFDSLNNS